MLVLFLNIYFFGIIVILFTGHIKDIQRKLIRSNNRNIDYGHQISFLENDLENINQERLKLIEHDAESFRSITDSMAYDLSFHKDTPMTRHEYIMVRGTMPEIHCQFDQLDLIHHNSLVRIAEEVSRNLAILAKKDVLIFLVENMRFKTILKPSELQSDYGMYLSRKQGY